MGQRRGHVEKLPLRFDPPEGPSGLECEQQPFFFAMPHEVGGHGQGTLPLDDEKSYTILAPTNEAFRELLYKLDLTERQLLEDTQLLVKVTD